MSLIDDGNFIKKLWGNNNEGCDVYAPPFDINGICYIDEPDDMKSSPGPV